MVDHEALSSQSSEEGSSSEYSSPEISDVDRLINFFEHIEDDIVVSEKLEKPHFLNWPDRFSRMVWFHTTRNSSISYGTFVKEFRTLQSSMAT